MLMFNSERNRCMGFTKNDILTGLKTWLKELCTIKDYRDVVYIIISIGVLCMVSISYSLKFDESVRQIEVLTQEVKDLRYQSMTMSSKYMNSFSAIILLNRGTSLISSFCTYMRMPSTPFAFTSN